MTPTAPLKGRWGTAPVLAQAKMPSDGLAELRQKAYQRFRELGFPTLRHEDWKYTNLKPIAETDFDLPSAVLGSKPESLLARAGVPQFDGIQLVFRNGRFCADLSTSEAQLPKGIRLQSLSEAYVAGRVRPASLKDVSLIQRPLLALNAAAFDEGLYVKIAAGSKIEPAIHLCFVAETAGQTPVQNHPRVYLEMGERSEAVAIESYWEAGDALSFTNAVVEFDLAPDARLSHVLLQSGAAVPSQIQTHYVGVELRRASQYDSTVVTLGGKLVRNDLDVRLGDSESNCSLSGVFIVGEGQHVDNHTLVDHAMPNGRSAQVYKGILSGNGVGVFNGKILVRPDAQQTDAQQSNKNLLLSAEATLNTRPQLEIYADEVKCTHGATVGRLEENALFYLKSRGIDTETATALLTQAFASEIFSKVPVEAIRNHAERWLTESTKGVYEN